MQKFTKPAAVLVPFGEFEGGSAADALAATTDLCIAAHQDDIEIMAFGPIAACFDDAGRRFSGVVVSDGAGSPRSGPYAGCTDEQMKKLRAAEQLNAARIGRYAAQALLGFTSAEIKDKTNAAVADDLEKLLLTAAPKNVYTHNLADKHDTHVAVALRVIGALRRLPPKKRPEKVYGMEVWRGLDWLLDSDKVLFNTAAHPNLAAALLGVHDSQITGGKRYDAAALGRRLANATFFESHATDKAESLSFAMDITPLMEAPGLSPAEFAAGCIESFKNDVAARLNKLF
uniref:PIG-L family deacetylase n=1 Tax=termite gut metagenome TaxID=433724 RepID=S0DDQ3_9ZZZZ